MDIAKFIAGSTPVANELAATSMDPRQDMGVSPCSPLVRRWLIRSDALVKESA